MTMDPERLRIRGYLQSQSEKPIDYLISKVEEGIVELAAAANAIDPAKRTIIPPGETWSPTDCLKHATSSDIHCATQILTVAHTGELPPGREDKMPDSFEAMLGRHREAMDSLYEHVRAADPGGFLQVKWKHPFFGDLNWREWLLFLRIHAKDHSGQLQAMRAAMAAK